MKRETVIKCTAGSIEQKAAMLSKMILVDITGGGMDYTYSDYSINGLLNDYKKLLASLIEDESDRPYERMVPNDRTIRLYASRLHWQDIRKTPVPFQPCIHGIYGRCMVPGA